MHLTGRIREQPDQLIHQELLVPQFLFEAEHMLSGYLYAEKVLLLEYERMGLVSREAASEAAEALSSITKERLAADAQSNMSDISFAIEQHVHRQMAGSIPNWHMDRSRNDFQACAQIMYARGELFALVENMLAFGESLLRKARLYTDMPMPGYTHYQTAQVITPAFYLTAMAEQVIGALDRLRQVFDAINKCPLGSGAMAGLELAWDRERMAELLGFDGPNRHALVAVAAREWPLRITHELSLFSVALSRFVTDLIQWSSSEYNFLLLTDSLAGISSAMPQKRNYPVLERLRGLTGHISAFSFDILLGHRNTAYSNLVEVSKEATRNIGHMFRQMETLLKLFALVVDHLEFKPERMLEICEREYLGGFALANQLTLQHDIPYRQAQVIVGQYIVRAIERQLPAQTVHVELLQQVCDDFGMKVVLEEGPFRGMFDPAENLTRKVTNGSTNPTLVRGLIDQQQGELTVARDLFAGKADTIKRALQRVDLRNEEA
ncbi:MAG: lyase family protein [Tumebacillaceae bacterium]